MAHSTLILRVKRSLSRSSSNVDTFDPPPRTSIHINRGISETGLNSPPFLLWRKNKVGEYSWTRKRYERMIYNAVLIVGNFCPPSEREQVFIRYDASFRLTRSNRISRDNDKYTLLRGMTSFLRCFVNSSNVFRGVFRVFVRNLHGCMVIF